MKQGPTIAEILARYPGPVTLYAPISFTVVLPLICAQIGVYLCFQDDARSRATGIVFGALFLLYALFNNLRPSRIELTAWGFTTTDYGAARIRCAWRAVSRFHADRSGKITRVRYTDRNFEDTLFGPERHVVLSYPFPAEQMATLMNAWRDRSLGVDSSEEA